MRVIWRSDYTSLSVNPISIQAPQEWPLSKTPFFSLAAPFNFHKHNYIFAFFPCGSSRGRANSENLNHIVTMETLKSWHELNDQNIYSS